MGDKFQKADGSNLTIDKVEFVKLDEPVTVYNFAVADFHTYYVTDLGIWVHNTGTDGSCNFTFPKSNKDMKTVFGIDDKTFHKEVKPENPSDENKVIRDYVDQYVNGLTI